MVNLEQNIKKIVALFATPDPSTGLYPTWQERPLSDETRQQIEAHLTTLFSQYLAQDGTKEEQINKRRKELIIHFHPDKIKLRDPETHWLEQAMSQGNFGGHCSSLAGICADAIKQESKQFNAYENISNMEEFRELLKRRLAEATTLTQKAVIKHMLDILDSAEKHDPRTKEVDQDWLKKTLRTLPYITSGVCISLYITELALLYSLTYSISLGSRWMAKSSSHRWQAIAYHTNKMSTGIAQASTMLISMFIKLNFFAFDSAYHYGTVACSAIYNALTEKYPAPSGAAASSSSFSESSPAMAFSPVHLLGGRAFQSLELKMLSGNLEAWQEQQKMQWLSTMRKGEYKRQRIDIVLTQLQMIDQSPSAMDVKLQQSKDILRSLLDDSRVAKPYSRAHLAVASAMSMCEGLLSGRAPALSIEYHPDALTSGISSRLPPIESTQESDDDAMELFPDEDVALAFSA
ncbi:hypothetical protein [Legionella sp. CNM-4043-24]|uniref:hypothetical protein n=1 Tax=Legionella sp. CNM-4043-24 TaxID=3421646 RepID=UPI00403A8B25